MKRSIPILALLFLSGSVYAADYDSRKYIPEFVPYNYDDAVEMSDFNECATALDKYDEGYYLLEWKEVPGSKEGAVYYRYKDSDPSGITSLGQLQARVEDEIRDCVAEYPEYREKVEAELEAEAAEERAKEMEKKKEEAISNALNECDLEYLDRISDQDRMANYSRIVECRELREKEKEDVNEKPVQEPTPSVQPTQNLLPTTPSIPPETVIAQPAPVGGSEAVSNTNSRSASSSATTTDKIEMSAEEFDRVVTERVNQALEGQTEDEGEQEQPSFFRRAINFLFGWMW